MRMQRTMRPGGEGESKRGEVSLMKGGILEGVAVFRGHSFPLVQVRGDEKKHHMMIPE